MWFVGVLKDGSAALTVEIFVHNLAVSHLDPMDLDGRWWEMWIKVKSLSIFFIVSPLNPIEPPLVFIVLNWVFFIFWNIFTFSILLEYIHLSIRLADFSIFSFYAYKSGGGFVRTKKASTPQTSKLSFGGGLVPNPVAWHTGIFPYNFSILIISSDYPHFLLFLIQILLSILFIFYFILF